MFQLHSSGAWIHLLIIQQTFIGNLAGTELETGDKKMNKTSLRYHLYFQIVHPVVCLCELS